MKVRHLNLHRQTRSGQTVQYSHVLIQPRNLNLHRQTRNPGTITIWPDSTVRLVIKPGTERNEMERNETKRNGKDRQKCGGLASATPYQPQHWMYYITITSTRKLRRGSGRRAYYVSLQWNVIIKPHKT